MESYTCRCRRGGPLAVCVGGGVSPGGGSSRALHCHVMDDRGLGLYADEAYLFESVKSFSGLLGLLESCWCRHFHGHLCFCRGTKQDCTP